MTHGRCVGGTGLINALHDEVELPARCHAASLRQRAPASAVEPPPAALDPGPGWPQGRGQSPAEPAEPPQVPGLPYVTHPSRMPCAGAVRIILARLALCRADPTPATAQNFPGDDEGRQFQPLVRDRECSHPSPRQRHPTLSATPGPRQGHRAKCLPVLISRRGDRTLIAHERARPASMTPLVPVPLAPGRVKWSRGLCSTSSVPLQVFMWRKLCSLMPVVMTLILDHPSHQFHPFLGPWWPVAVPPAGRAGAHQFEF